MGSIPIDHSNFGKVAEWFIALVLKTSDRATDPRVQISPFPLKQYNMAHFDDIRIPYYHATFLSPDGKYRQVVDMNSHPFIWMAIEYADFGRPWTLIQWQKISEAEYDVFAYCVKNSLIK